MALKTHFISKPFLELFGSSLCRETSQPVVTALAAVVLFREQFSEPVFRLKYFKWGFPKIGVPHTIIHFMDGFSVAKTIQLLGYPHDGGNPQVVAPDLPWTTQPNGVAQRSRIREFGAGYTFQAGSKHGIMLMTICFYSIFSLAPAPMNQSFIC